MEKFHDKMEENFVIDTGNKRVSRRFELDSIYISVSFFGRGKRVRANLLF